jgi:sugar lactone lactonase YvrE
MCVNPDSKAIEEVINFPVSKITSCAFGGDRLEQLFVTSAKVDVNEMDEPLAGKTFVFSPGVLGAPSYQLL